MLINLKMAVNYYQCLGLKSTAAREDVLEAYRKLALLTHPHRETVMLKERETKMALFAEISEAFEVLSDGRDGDEVERLRAVYDNLGEEGLKKDKRSSSGGRSISEATRVGRRLQIQKQRPLNIRALLPCEQPVRRSTRSPRLRDPGQPLRQRIRGPEP